MLLEHHDQWNFDSLNIIAPGAGAGNLKDLISFAISFCSDYIVLLDSDESGVKAYERYSRFFGEEQIDHLSLYATPSITEGIVLEDFLSETDTTRLLEVTDSTDEKRAIAQLYFSDKKPEELSGETLIKALLTTFR